MNKPKPASGYHCASGFCVWVEAVSLPTPISLCSSLAVLSVEPGAANRVQPSRDAVMVLVQTQRRSFIIKQFCTFRACLENLFCLHGKENRAHRRGRGDGAADGS